MDFVPGTLAQASGPHYEKSVLDEVDELRDPLVQQKFASTATGPRSTYIMASTYSYATGPMATILREQPHIPTRIWCIFEALQSCVTECDAAPLPDGSTGRCPFYDEEVTGQDGRRTRALLCGGEKARRSDGHIPLAGAISKFYRVGAYMAGVELFCRRPQMGMGGGLAYWAYAPENRLGFDPEIRRDVPLEISLDFNPGRGKEMCWLILQAAPPEYGLAWWVVDEIVLPTSSTPYCLDEVVRRYGPGGSMLPDAWRHEGVTSGIWIYGDASGDSPQSASVWTDYQLVVQRLGKWADFRLLVPAANPPRIDRLNRSNELLWDPLSGRRAVKVANRAKRFLDELARVPLEPGTRQKDKSERVQRLGLTHLSDDFEYWVWARFPGGLHAEVRRPTIGTEQRATAPWAMGQERASGGYEGGGRDLPAPWSSSGRGRG